jgi:hypothetical protein
MIIKRPDFSLPFLTLLNETMLLLIVGVWKETLSPAEGLSFLLCVHLGASGQPGRMLPSRGCCGYLSHISFFSSGEQSKAQLVQWLAQVPITTCLCLMVNSQVCLKIKMKENESRIS